MKHFRCDYLLPFQGNSCRKSATCRYRMPADPEEEKKNVLRPSSPKAMFLSFKPFHSKLDLLARTLFVTTTFSCFLTMVCRPCAGPCPAVFMQAPLSSFAARLLEFLARFHHRQRTNAPHSLHKHFIFVAVAVCYSLFHSCWCLDTVFLCFRQEVHRYSSRSSSSSSSFLVLSLFRFFLKKTEKSTRRKGACSIAL